MKFLPISHRGCISGPNPERENTSSFIDQALRKGFCAEIDIWYLESKFWLGHDKPGEQVDFSYLNKLEFFCHCKNLDAAFKLAAMNPVCDFFIHDQDCATLTNKGWIWTFPGQKTCGHSIIVDKSEKWVYEDVGGVCADYLIQNL